MSSCVTVTEVCITRGDVFAMDVGLTTTWSEVYADPAGYIGTLVLREKQDDTLPEELTLTAVPQPVYNPTPNTPQVYMEFNATAEQTQQLPEYDLVGYVQIAPLTAPKQSVRLFNMEVDIHD